MFLLHKVPNSFDLGQKEISWSSALPLALYNFSVVVLEN